MPLADPRGFRSGARGACNVATIGCEQELMSQRTVDLCRAVRDPADSGAHTLKHCVKTAQPHCPDDGIDTAATHIRTDFCGPVAGVAKAGVLSSCRPRPCSLPFACLAGSLFPCVRRRIVLAPGFSVRISGRFFVPVCEAAERPGSWVYRSHVWQVLRSRA